MLYLDNLSSQELKQGILPWEFIPSEPIPEDVRKDKKQRDVWINHPSTKHHVYTLCEGVNSGLRISRAKSDGSGNPVHSCHGFAADYDGAANEVTVLQHASKLPIPPNWIERTLSGYWRFIWLLEFALLFPSFEFAQHFLGTFSEFAFDPALGMIGFDSGAWISPERMFTNGCDWRPLNPNKISKDVALGWLVQAGHKFKFTDSFGVTIPLDVVKPELQARFPKFSEWPGDFTLDSQGPSFWVEGSQSPKSAIVRAQGMQTFSDHAGKAFFSWAELLGVAFVKQFETEAAARATKDILFDGKHYFRKLPSELYKPHDKQDLINHLRVSRGVSNKAPKNDTSEVEKCLEHIQNFQRVEIAAPFPFRPSGLITINGEQVLNTSMRRVMQPASGTAVWGPLGQFPWLSNFFGRFFSNPEQLDYCLSHLAHFYQSALLLKPVSGHAVFLAGLQGTGKTFFSTGVVGPIFGGFRDASKYLMGMDPFGGELFEVAIWTVDDSVSSVNARAHRTMSEMTKRTVANRTFTCNTKFQKAHTIEWVGRVFVSLNCDEESIRMLPDLDISIKDKLMLFRTADQTVEFPRGDRMAAILKAELPWLCRFLADWTMPAHCEGDSRFGVKAYHEKSLVESARLSSRTAGFAEILEDWKSDYFSVREPKAEFWSGTAFQLQKEFLLDPSAETAVRPFTVDAIGRHLSTLMNKGMKISCSSTGESRVWKIFR